MNPTFKIEIRTTKGARFTVQNNGDQLNATATEICAEFDEMCGLFSRIIRDHHDRVPDEKGQATDE